MLRIEVKHQSGDQDACIIGMNGSSMELLADMHIAIISFCKGFLRNVKPEHRKHCAMEIAQGFAKAVHEGYMQVQEEKNATSE